MIEVEGLLFDGKKVYKSPTRLIVDDTGKAHLENRPDHKFNFSLIMISPRTGNATRFLTLPGGKLFESTENETLDKLISFHGQNKHSTRNNEAWTVKIGLMLAFLLLTWIGIHYGVPSLTLKVAQQIPEQMLIEHGQEAMKEMDKSHFIETKIPQKRRQALQEKFKEILPENNKFDYKLHFRDSETVGANAFALPSGDIILTDKLVNIAANDDELVSVILHEIAHVELRHAAQGVIRKSTLLLLVVAITGDITSLSTVLLGTQALLLESSYSRQMEWEADGYSLERMRALKINPIVFSNILSKIVKAHIEDSEKQKDKKASSNQTTTEDPSTSYWSNHPPSDDRIERFKKASVEF